MDLSKTKIIPAILFIFTILTLLLSLISYTNLTNLSMPTLSTLFFGTIIVVITSKLLTIYSTIKWRLSSEYKNTPQKEYIYLYTIAMILGIYVYFNVGCSNIDRQSLFSILKENKSVAIIITLGILIYYSFCAFTSYKLYNDKINAGQDIFSNIFIISVVDFFFFLIFFIRFWYEY